MPWENAVQKLLSFWWRPGRPGQPEMCFYLNAPKRLAFWTSEPGPCTHVVNTTVARGGWATFQPSLAASRLLFSHFLSWFMLLQTCSKQVGHFAKLVKLFISFVSFVSLSIFLSLPFPHLPGKRRVQRRRSSCGATLWSCSRGRHVSAGAARRGAILRNGNNSGMMTAFPNWYPNYTIVSWIRHHLTSLTHIISAILARKWGHC